MPIELTGIDRGSTRSRATLEDIPEDVTLAVLEALEFCTAHPDKRVSAKFGTVEEAEDFLYQARSYAYHAKPRLVVTGNTTASGHARFTVALYDQS
jgi:hypothetical protein